MRHPIRHATGIGILTALALAIPYTMAVLGDNFDFEVMVQAAQKRYGAQAQQTVTLWRDTLISLRDADESEKIRKVNEFFNRRVRFRDDNEIWGQSDYWATPLETMARAQGDCEDFAIAKYFSLMILNIPTDRLRITYVKARIGGARSTVSEAHMVLGYYPDPEAEPMILDNLLQDIRPASRRSDLTPVFSFNSEGLWAGGAQSGRSSGSATARLSRWRDLITRMQAEGFQ